MFGFPGWIFSKRQRLVLLSSSLACLQLLQVEVASLVVAVRVFDTSGEVSCVNVTWGGLLAVVALGLDGWCLLQLLLFGWSVVGARAGEHGGQTGTQSMADGGTNGDTSSGGSHLCEHTRLLWSSGGW